jgi:chemotaxis protein methyltransferase CheR
MGQAATTATTATAALPAVQFVLSDDEFREFQLRILDQAGIALSESKRALVTTRVSRRLRRLGLSSFRDYLDLLTHGDTDGEERVEFVNSITTNKTDFFREQHHFAFLRDTVLPEVIQRTPRGEPLRLRLWSAACSTGQEPYTLAMTVAEAGSEWQRADVRILASDIDTNVLHTASAGAYDAERLEQVPAALRERWFHLAQDGSGTIAPMLRDWVVFRQINFMDVPWPIRTHFDAILCRNVAIYFARDTQRWLFENLAAHLAPGGYLMVGHSENLAMMSDLFDLVGPTTYRRREAGARAVTRRATPETTARAASKPPVQHPSAVAATPRAAQREEVRIGIGGVHASNEPIVIRTVLGSCVSACLYDPVARVGGMNHFMLPEGVSDDGLATRFGVHAMELLMNRLLELGADRRRLRAKVFGGAFVMQSLSAHATRVPEHNVAFVKHFLETDGIPIVAQRLGGRAALQVLFEPDSGRVLARALTSREVGHLPEDEERHRIQIVREATKVPSGEVTLFWP